MDQRLLHKFGWWLLAAGMLLYAKNMIYDVFLLSHRNDFGHLYCAGFLAARGGDIFDPQLLLSAAAQNGIERVNPFVYPPFFAIVLIPLSWVPYNSAWLLFNLLSHTAFILAVSCIIGSFRKQHEPAALWWGGLIFVSALFAPMQKTYMAGQMNTFMLLVIAAAWYSCVHQKHYIMGVILGLGAAVKVSPGFFFLYFLYKRNWKAASALLFTLAVCFGISYAYFGQKIHLNFINEVQQMSYGKSTWAQFDQKYHIEPHNQAPSALWYRLLTDNPTTTGIVDAPGTAKALSYFTAVLILAVLIIGSKWNAEANARELALWSFGMLWIPSLMWDHYLIQLLFAIAVGFRIILNGQTCRGWLFFVGMALMGMDYPFHFDYEPFKTGSGVLMMNLKLYGSIMVFLYILRNQDQSETISNS